MDTWVWDQVSLELGKIDVEGTIESEGGGDGWDDLTDQSVKIGVGWSFDIQITSADVVDGFVINHESTVGVFQGGVGGKDGVVWFDNSGGDLWGWVDGELQLGFFTVINGKTFHQKGSETGTGTTTEWVEDEETLEMSVINQSISDNFQLRKLSVGQGEYETYLKTSTLISEFSDSVEDEINDFFTNGVVTSGIVVGGIFFTSDQLFWVEKLSVCTSADFINNSWFQINENGTWDMFASTSFREKGVEWIIT